MSDVHGKDDTLLDMGSEGAPRATGKDNPSCRAIRAAFRRWPYSVAAAEEGNGMTVQQKRENDAWIDVVAQLLEAGAVTVSDGRAPAGSKDTLGQKLYTAIRTWGKERSILTLEDWNSGVRQRLTQLEAVTDKQQWAREINVLRWVLGE